MRLDRYVAEAAQISRADAKAAVRAGRVRVARSWALSSRRTTSSSGNACGLRRPAARSARMAASVSGSSAR